MTLASTSSSTSTREGTSTSTITITWADRRKWLLSLGMTPITIGLYRLGDPAITGMSELAWECMVREAMRNAGTDNRRKGRKGKEERHVNQRSER